MAWRWIWQNHLVAEGLAQAIELPKQQAFPVNGIFTGRDFFNPSMQLKQVDNF